MKTRGSSLNTLAWQALICITVLSIWQWGYQFHARFPWAVPDLLDPYFISKPSEIFDQFLILSCLKSKLGVFNGWFNGDFAKCMARTENIQLLWTGPKGPARKLLVLRTSSDDGISFPQERVISDQLAAYSDLTVLKDNSVGILWERGIEKSYQFITFTRVNQEWLEGGR
jgi:hypothetical protein